MSDSVDTTPQQRDNDPVPQMKVLNGPIRPFLSVDPDQKLAKLRSVHTMKEKLLVLALATFTGLIRLYNLAQPDSVVFDEVHFGGFAAEYIRGTFFMDVHPPLAKMLFAAVAYIAGFQGDFDFEHIGDKFPATTPYQVMRLFSAVMGALTVILLYATLRFSGVTIAVALLMAVAFAVENSFVTISRYILLDAPLIFFIAFTAYSFKRFEIYPLDSWNSYKQLLITGIGMGLALSSKWVGLFTVAWVGLLCIWKLWFMIGDLTIKPLKVIKLVIAKLSCLLAVPFVVYLIAFKIHFDTLVNEGEGSGFMSSAFRASLNGNTIPSNILKDVGVSSVVTIRHVGTMGGYLHSHPHMFETGSGQQQITLYPHLDDNNKWIIEAIGQPGVTFPNFDALRNGQQIRLLHPLTYCHLHSHDFPAPVSEFSDWQTEVSCYGRHGFPGDINDTWIVEIVQDATPPGPAREKIIALQTIFRLKHSITGCFLFSHDVKLPAWGFEQQEVSCATQGKDELTQWYIESNENMNLDEESERVSYPIPTFWDKFVESHQKMWFINKNLVDTHVYASYPNSWPFLTRGIAYWGEEHKRVYLLGNAIMWWSVSLFAAMFVGVVALELISWQLGWSTTLSDSHVLNFHIQTIHYLLGFVIHFIPSFLMKRQLFLHHYLPAYYFGILALGHAFDIVVSYVCKRKRTVGLLFAIIFTLGCGYFFYTFKPLIYGSEWTKAECLKSQWLPNWDYDCSTYFDTYEEYKNMTLTE